MSNKLAIVGWRYFKDYDLLCKVVDEFVQEHGKPQQIISGGAPGADTMAERYAKEKGIPMVVFKPDFRKYGGKRAFAMRDKEIARACSHMIAFPNMAKGRGTQITIEFAKSFDKFLIIHEIK